MGLFRNYVNQTRKPEGFLGKLMVDGMNGGHAKLADWGMQFLPETAPDKIVEIGCGGGRNAGALLKKYPASHVTAVDYSPVSVAKAIAYNKQMIAAGRCRVTEGSASALPVSSDSIALATAFETVYFWPQIETCFAEVRRVLKEGGTFMICNESDGTDETSLKFEKIIDGMKCYTPQQLAAALRTAGFSEVNAVHHPKKPWITVIARK
ncbi:MAG: class I SAM-dependent methyltransferase [Clostridia bacterium]|nr:class I SAM-dependent methyltransferase [Clostridia bacterium]